MKKLLNLSKPHKTTKNIRIFAENLNTPSETIPQK